MVLNFFRNAITGNNPITSDIFSRIRWAIRPERDEEVEVMEQTTQQAPQPMQTQMQSTSFGVPQVPVIPQREPTINQAHNYLSSINTRVWFQPTAQIGVQQQQTQQRPQEMRQQLWESIVSRLGNLSEEEIGLATSLRDQWLDVVDVWSFIEKQRELWVLSEQEIEMVWQLREQWLSPVQVADSLLQAREDMQQQVERGEQVEDSLKGIATAIWWTAASLAGLWAAGEWLQRVGRFLYGLTLPPTKEEAEAIQSFRAWAEWTAPRTTVDVALESPLIQEWGRSLRSRLGLFGTRSNIWEQAEAAARNIFTNTINPIFEQADVDNVNFDYSSLIDEAKQYINDFAWYSNEEKLAILDDIDEIAERYQWSSSLKNLDLEKQSLMNLIPNKYKWDARLPRSLQAARSALAWAFRNAVHNTISTVYGVDSAKLYQDYNSLRWLSQIWPKARTQWGRKWWFGGITSWILEELITPVSTTAGKVSYKLGELSKYIPKKVLQWIKSAAKSGRILFAIDPIDAPELLQYVPWTIGDSFQEYTQANPASVALRWLESLWLSEDEAISEISEETWFDEETSRKIYNGDLIVY